MKIEEEIAMKKERVRYYIQDEKGIIGKCVGNNCYILRETKWELDRTAILSYGLEKSLLKKGFKEIEYSIVQEIEADQLVESLIKKWNLGFEKEKEEWNKNPGWPAKLVETRFELNGWDYRIFSSDISHGVNDWDDGFMESVQSKMKEDLEEIGAKNIYNIGFLD